jgi:hypothetical protein
MTQPVDAHEKERPMKRWLIRSAFFFLLAFLFTQSFSRNILSVGLPYDPNRWQANVFETFQGDSEMSVTLMMEKTRKDGLGSTGGFMMGVSKDGKRDLQSPVYPSTFGLQGKILSFLYYDSSLTMEEFCGRARLVIALLFALTMATFVLFVHREFGLSAAVTLTGLLLVSDWLVFVARNLYYIYFLLLLPLVLSFVLFPRLMLCQRPKSGLYFTIIGGVVLIRSLCFVGYESNLILSTAVAPIYYGIRDGRSWRQVARWALFSLCASSVAVALAILATLIQGVVWFKSFDVAAQTLFQRYSARLYGGADLGSGAPVGVSIFDIFSQYLPQPMVSVPCQSAFRYRIYLSLFSFIALIPATVALAFSDARWFSSFEAQRRKVLGLTAAVLWGFLASLSWAFIMKGHMYHHIHMNGMIFYLPFLPMMYILLGKEFGLLARDFVSAVKPWIVPPKVKKASVSLRGAPPIQGHNRGGERRRK